jgi:hypothetical protein
MGGGTVAADAVRIISPLLVIHHAEHVLYEVCGSTQTPKYQPCMHSHVVSSLTPEARFRTSCAGLEIKAPEFRAQAREKLQSNKDVSSRRQEPVDKSAERNRSQAQIRGLSGRVRNATNTPSYFSLHGTKGCNNKRFLPSKIEEREFDSGVVVYHHTPFWLSRTVSNEAGTILCAAPQARVGMRSKMQTIS